jgi:hypothetical protein
MERAMNKPRLPKTDSIQKLATFWDTHDLTDFEDDLVAIDTPVFVRGKAQSSRQARAAGARKRRTARGTRATRGTESEISVPLKTPEAQAVERMARSKGVSPQSLLRTWVLQKISRRSNGHAGRR